MVYAVFLSVLDMLLKLSSGLSKALENWPLYLILSLSLIWVFILRIRGHKITVKNVPQAWQEATIQAFSKSKYKNLINYWLAVSKMETGGFKSNLYLSLNNPWGMKVARRRPNSQSGASGEWARYASLRNAAEDIIQWMEYQNFPSTIPDLYGFIQVMKANGYFAGESVEDYYKKVVAWQKR